MKTALDLIAKNLIILTALSVSGCVTLKPKISECTIGVTALLCYDKERKEDYFIRWFDDEMRFNKKALNMACIPRDDWHRLKEWIALKSRILEYDD